MVKGIIARSRQDIPRPSTIALVALAVMTADYFFDPYKGHGRRAVLRTQASATKRRTFRRLTRYLRYEEGRGRGLLERRFHLHGPDNPIPDDLTLRDRVETQLFRDRTIPKGSINVSVAYRTVELRGQVADKQTIEAIVDRVLAVPGVGWVRSFLHVPGTPAPNKLPALVSAHHRP
jgi:hypothetical protein